MDKTQKWMNILFAPIALIMLLMITPLFLLFNFFSSIIRSRHPENVAGMVVLITGASSGIGEDLAYEYARRGARLALAARREDRLREVADKARGLGSPDVMVIPTNVSDVDHCNRFIDEAVNHFGQLDHLVNNAGIANACMFEDCDVSEFTSIMNINFWGSVYVTRAAVPHLKKSRGKIIVVASCAAWICIPKTSIYNASKAAQMMFFETLRVESGSDFGITIVTPGLIETEMTVAENLTKMDGTFLSSAPMASTEGCAEAIVNSACRGDKYLTYPCWAKLGYWCKVLCPELLSFLGRLSLVTKTRSLKKD